MSIRAVFCGAFMCAYLCVGSTMSVPELSERRDIPPRCIENSVTAVSCEGVGEDSLLAHPDDCELFYYCVSGDSGPVCRQCPAHLHFSPIQHVCAAPDVAGCLAHPLL